MTDKSKPAECEGRIVDECDDTARTINVAPKPYTLLEDFAPLTKPEHDPALARRHHTSLWLQEFVARFQNRVEHGLVEQGIAHPLRDDNIDVLDVIRKRYVFDFSADNTVHF